MLKRSAQILIALVLILSTSSSVWGQYLVEKAGIEISEKLEKEAEKSEKELEDKFDDWDGSYTTHSNEITALFSGFLKAGSSTYTPTSLKPKKLYLVFHQLKIHC